MRYLTVDEVLELHDRVIRQSGGAAGLRDRGGWNRPFLDRGSVGGCLR